MKNELRDCVEARIRWYETALNYRKRGIMPPIGFPIPDSEPKVWEDIVKELKNILKTAKKLGIIE